jgi:hypothetical protein
VLVELGRDCRLYIIERHRIDTVYRIDHRALASFSLLFAGASRCSGAALRPS